MCNMRMYENQKEAVILSAVACRLFTISPIFSVHALPPQLGHGAPASLVKLYPAKPVTDATGEWCLGMLCFW